MLGKPQKKSYFLNGRAIKRGGGVEGRDIKEKKFFFFFFFFLFYLKIKDILLKTTY